MALNHFASQIKESQAEQVVKQVAIAPSLDTQVKKPSKLEQLQTLRAKNSYVQQPTKPEAAAKHSSINTAQLENTINSEPNVNPALKEIPLTWSDQQMLCALSAMQVRYGRSAEAIPYLMMVRKINPKNIECARLLALAFMRLNRWQEAEAMVEELDYLQKANSGSAVNGLVLLYRSLVSFKTNKIADAKSWFGKFRSFNRVN